jgi:hypothetical protein
MQKLMSWPVCIGNVNTFNRLPQYEHRILLQQEGNQNDQERMGYRPAKDYVRKLKFWKPNHGCHEGKGNMVPESMMINTRARYADSGFKMTNVISPAPQNRLDFTNKSNIKIPIWKRC